MDEVKKKQTVLIKEGPMRYHLPHVRARLIREAEKHLKEGFRVIVQCVDGRKLLFSTWMARQEKE